MHAKDLTYSTGQKNHFDVCYSFEVVAPSKEIDHFSSHFGWELTFAPTKFPKANATIQHRKKEYSIQKGKFLFINALEDHIEKYSQKENGHVRAIVFSDLSINSILSETQINPKEVTRSLPCCYLLTGCIFYTSILVCNRGDSDRVTFCK